MYSAFSLVVSCFAVAVFPVHGVPVMSMTRLRLFMVVFDVEESFIRSANSSARCVISLIKLAAQIWKASEGLA